MRPLLHSASLDAMVSLLLTLQRAELKPTMHFRPWGVARMRETNSLSPPPGICAALQRIAQHGGEICEEGDVSLRIDDFNRDPTGAFAVSALIDTY